MTDNDNDNDNDNGQRCQAFVVPGLALVVGPVDGVQPDHHLQF